MPAAHDDDDLSALVHGPDHVDSSEAGARTRERWLRQEAEDGATFAGVLADLADLGATLTVRGRSGAAYAGRVAAVATDGFILALADGSRALLAHTAVVEIRPDPAHRLGAAAGDRAAPATLTIEELLRSEAAHRPRVRVASVGGPPLSGRLRAVGIDVVTVALDGDTRSVCYLPSSSLSEVVLLVSG